MTRSRPLAEKLRPQDLSEVVGQEHLLQEGGFLAQALKAKTPRSLILWGPPGCGKTTIARLYAKAFDARMVSFSAVFSGVADLRKVVSEAESAPLFNHRTLLFVDEIHRFNKAQQDGFLPYVEKGTFILIGATTENPSFALNNALLSRCHVLELKPLDEEALEALITRYEAKHTPLSLPPEKRRELIAMAQGDGRYLYNLIDALAPGETSLSTLSKRAALYDKAGEGHYNLISALHKSVRGSDPDASLYWLARMLEGGEEPLYLIRRLIRMASEDIGLADPQALPLAIATRETYQMLGSPEGELAIAQLTLYLALAPKSNATYTAYKAARSLAAKTGHLAPPKTILNAPTKVMKALDYGSGYIYDHDTPEGFSGQNYFPDEIERPAFYGPVSRGFEREMLKRLTYFTRLRHSGKKDRDHVSSET